VPPLKFQVPTQHFLLLSSQATAALWQFCKNRYIRTWCSYILPTVKEINICRGTLDLESTSSIFLGYFLETHLFIRRKRLFYLGWGQ